MSSNSRPFHRTEPEASTLRGKSPITASPVRVFPHPDSPTMPRFSPSVTAKLTPDTTSVSP